MRMGSNRRLANIKTRSETGLDYVMQNIDLNTPFGKKQLKEIKPYFPGEEDELRAELDKLESMVEFVRANGRLVEQIQEMFKPQIALVPIGGKRTMDIEEASMAVNSHFNFDLVIPMHYNTFPYMKADPNEFKKKVNFHNVKILDIGERVNV